MLSPPDNSVVTAGSAKIYVITKIIVITIESVNVDSLKKFHLSDTLTSSVDCSLFPTSFDIHAQNI